MRPIEREEKEMEILLKELPHASSRLPHNHPNRNVHAHAHGIYDGMVTKSMPSIHGLPDMTFPGPNDHIRGYKYHDYSYGGDVWHHAHWSPSSLFSDGSSGSGSLSPDKTQPGLGSHLTTEEQLSLIHRLQSMYLENSRDTLVRLPQNPIDPSIKCGFNLPVNYSDNDAFGVPHCSVRSDPLLFSSGSLRNFEGDLCNNGGVINRLPVNLGTGHGFVPFQYMPSSISEALLRSQMVDLENYNRLINPVNSSFGSELVRKRDGFEPIEASKCEESLIIQGSRLNYGPGPSIDRMKTRKNYKRGNLVNIDNLPSNKAKKSQNSSQSCENLMGVKGYLYHMAKDQHGCRFLQHKFEQGKSQVDLVFDEVVDHAMELMVNQFGNYLMQKLLEVCDEEQRMRLVALVTEDPMKLVKVSLNVHGTRVVQKLIETLTSRRQINLVISALKPGIVDLMKDLNGNHVVQQCLQSLKGEDNKFIFEAAAAHCVDIATHQHGCCVLQRCIACSAGENWAKLVAEVSCNGFLLAQDAFGNYVVQFVLDLTIPSANANLASQFEGRYVELSKQKFSSNVVEKCLKIFCENDKAKIILELLSVPRFDQLVQDPYANYVIHTALLTSKGSLHSALVEAIKPHAEVLRTNPHCKRIFSRSLLKK
ncbi:pumilio 4-like protein [Carex littledalei]|uniref:Pumilio 4-like protein n=1 Tax=Carex littledalei TaxID=544730 RepID=A0A833QRB6_9POAL|nr:pumilio 4-like protein [Carex littledalei]